jgi:uncharacterized membrane-anchored protein
MKAIYIKLIIFVIILLAGFGITTLVLSWPSITGKTYTLSTMPVDPFDLLRGQYFTIRYEINTLQNTNFNQNAIGQDIYVVIEKDSSGLSHAKSSSLTMPTQGDYIKGKIKSIYSTTATIEYGIEQYFVERGTQERITNMTVEVKVSKAGQARISRIFSQGKPLDI